MFNVARNLNDNFSESSDDDMLGNLLTSGYINIKTRFKISSKNKVVF